MQTILYYRDYAERARRVMENGDRRDIWETLATLACGFEEIARALESGEVVALPSETPESQNGSNCLRARARALENVAYFLSNTRH